MATDSHKLCSSILQQVKVTTEILIIYKFCGGIKTFFFFLDRETSLALLIFHFSLYHLHSIVYKLFSPCLLCFSTPIFHD